MTATLSSRRAGAPLFERRFPSLAYDRLNDFERAPGLPFLPLASTWMGKDQAAQMMRRIAVNSMSGLGERIVIICPQNIELNFSREWTRYGLLSDLKMRE